MQRPSEKEVLITYDPETGAWNAENPVQVHPGLTRITWRVKATGPSAGVIDFGTNQDFAGITFDAGWPGSQPKGDAREWSTEIADTMKPGDQPQSFHYTVNAWYRSDRSTPLPPQQVSWDPEVEEDPDPPPVKPPKT